ncbi:PHP domain-containing protein [Actinopolymorpha sp. B17G11]|uniref:PHP domain-containing protein n=1 Tax=unclassified Actinopolymorpha TaxID=2627063 RepID=UPI0032D8B78F
MSRRTSPPPDNHVHSEWSWDAENGSMERTCARAVEIGLPAIAFTEHADFTPWVVAADDPAPPPPSLVDADGLFSPPGLDVDGYLACLQVCRDKFPDLRIMSGVELGEAHWHRRAAADLLSGDRFDRVLGSLHALQSNGRYVEPSQLFREQPVAEVVWGYLAEVTRLIEQSDAFEVLAHIDYVLRYLPADAGPFDPTAFEDEFRTALDALARSGRALEVNTRLPLHAQVVRWWYDVGGEAVTFGSDAHEPAMLATGFSSAAAMVEAAGFHPGRHPYDFWRRHR